MSAILGPWSRASTVIKIESSNRHAMMGAEESIVNKKMVHSEHGGEAGEISFRV